MRNRQDQERDLRGRLAAATVTGLLAGAARAVTEWLLRHLFGV